MIDSQTSTTWTTTVKQNAFDTKILSFAYRFCIFICRYLSIEVVRAVIRSQACANLCLLKSMFTISVFRNFCADLKHGSVMCWSLGPPTLYSVRPTNRHTKDSSLMFSYKHALSNSLSPNQPSSSLQLTSVPAT